MLFTKYRKEFGKGGKVIIYCLPDSAETMHDSNW